MTPSDFLTLLGLAVAVWSIVPKLERTFFLLFFPPWQIPLLAFTSIFFVHFLISFDWLLANWWPWLGDLTIDGGIPASTYAYIVTIATIAFVFTRVSVGYYSKSRIGKTIEYYRVLLDQEHIDVLSNYILKFHVEDISGLLRKWSHMRRKSAMDIVLRRRTIEDEEHDRLIHRRRNKYAINVYELIVKDENFIRKAANTHPELFARIILGIETENASDKDFVQLFIEILFTTKNQKLIQELRILDGADDSILDRSKHIDLPIMTALMVHTKAAAANFVWYPVGQETRKSLTHDEDQRQFLRQEFDYQIQEELWNLKIYIAIVYFNYMVRETIYRESGRHMWLFMYDRFVDLLIANIPEDIEYSSSTEYPSFNHYLISKIVDNMTDWIDLAVDQSSEGHTIDVCKSIGTIAVHLGDTSNANITLDFKCRVFEKIIDLYFRLSKHENQIFAEFGRRHLELMLKNPIHPHWDQPSVSAIFLDVLRHAWSDFDKEPYRYREDNGSIQRFTSEVLIPLGIEEE